MSADIMTHKIEGKFYPLTPEVGQKLRAAKLTAAEWRLWCYLIEIDPFGEQYKELPDTLTILEEVDISKPTFYRAIAKFQKLNLFDFQDKGFSFRNLTRVSKMRRESQKGDDFLKNETGNLKNETSFSKMRQVSQKRENRRLEPLPDKDSSAPKIYKTYLDYIDSLSEVEREKFLEFGLKKAARLPLPPALPKKWIERNWQELREEFKNALSPTPSVDPSVLEQEQQEQREQRSAVLQELAELQKRQQEWKQHKPRAKQ